MIKVTYISGGIEIIEQISALWAELNDHHTSISKHFSSHFNGFSFNTRVSSLKQKSKDGDVLILIVRPANSDNAIGYSISSINRNGEGEIDSIYVRPEFRGNGIAREFMSKSMDWLNSKQVKDISIGVVYGNEETLNFYSKFGFFPKVTILQMNRN